MSQGLLGEPVDVRPLLEPERVALVALLRSLDTGHWSYPTACPAWTVHDLALHLVHDDLRRLSLQRDAYTAPFLQVDEGLDSLAAALDVANQQWVDAARQTISPQLTVELLSWLAAAAGAVGRGGVVNGTRATSTHGCRSWHGRRAAPDSTGRARVDGAADR